LAVLLLVIVILGSLAAYYSLALSAERSSGGLDAARIYANSSRSVVTVQGLRLEVVDTGAGPGFDWASIYASGFVVGYNASYYIVTNFHVVQRLVNATVTFWNGDAYRGKVAGSDAYSDLGIITTQAPANEFYPLEFAPSSSLRVGEPVVAIGNPYALSGTITSGIVGQIGRTISYDTGAGNTSYPIADAIQFSAPINPGNSGGPLLNPDGKVVGITTAGITGAEGLGFAIPSDTILREFSSLVSTGKYDKHSYLGISITDMTYELAKAVGANVTYGVLIVSSVRGGPAANSGLKSGTRSVDIAGQSITIGGDVIISINGTRATNTDAFSTYLERNTLPGQTIQVGIIRSGTYMVVLVVLGARPPPT
jgi:S1-C subfamily serine protease